MKKRNHLPALALVVCLAIFTLCGCGNEGRHQGGLFIERKRGEPYTVVKEAEVFSGPGPDAAALPFHMPIGETVYVKRFENGRAAVYFETEIEGRKISTIYLPEKSIEKGQFTISDG